MLDQIRLTYGGYTDGIGTVGATCRGVEIKMLMLLEIRAMPGTSVGTMIIFRPHANLLVMIMCDGLPDRYIATDLLSDSFL